MGAHTGALCLTADSSSSSCCNDEHETYEALPATTSESSESPAPAAAMIAYVCIALKGKYKKNSDQQSPIVALFTTVDGGNALLYEPVVNFIAKF